MADENWTVKPSIMSSPEAAAYEHAMQTLRLMNQAQAAGQYAQNWLSSQSQAQGDWLEAMRQMDEREQLEARLRYLRGQLANLDPGDFVARKILRLAIDKIQGQLYNPYSYDLSTGKAVQREPYVYMDRNLYLPDWVKNLGLVAQKGVGLGIPQALAPLGAQASLTPSQMTGLMGLITLAGEQPTTQKLPTSKKHLGLPNWAEYQKRVTNYLPSWLESYQALSQKLFPKTYSVRPRWATAYQR